MPIDTIASTPCGLLHAMAIAWAQSAFMGGLVGVRMLNRSARRAKFDVLQKWRRIWMEANDLWPLKN